MRTILHASRLMAGLCLAFLTGCATDQRQPAPQSFSFAVLADPRAQGDTWKNALAEVRDRHTPVTPAVTPAELILVVGDIDPLVDRHADYLGIFTNAPTRPAFVPVIGNHEFEAGGVHARYARDIVIPAIPGVVRRHATSCDYYVDHRNVRLIAIDAYTDLGREGVINEEGRQWVEQTITNAPPGIEHIFISFHEPAFPRVRHIGDSFDQNPERRNAFWRTLVTHADRVRAVFVGHTHSYYRLRVRDPAGPAANDPASFPDEDGGIWQVDAGAAGNGSENTVVWVQVEGRVVNISVLQAMPGANQPFAEKDRWRLPPL